MSDDGADSDAAAAPFTVLIVDDQRSARRVLTDLLARMGGLRLVEAGSLAEARACVARDRPDAALIDIRLSDDPRDRGGLVLAAELRAATSVVPVIVTASSEMASVRTAMRAGVFDFLLKDDLCPEVLVPVVEQLRERRRLELEVVALRARGAPDTAASALVGASRAMSELRARIQRVALSTRPALITGPTGSGKELVAQAVHRAGPHPEAPFIDVNCAAIPESLVQSQLFGHERGAFTGAERRHPGFFGAVGEGTLFLDEVGELPLGMQGQLLRVLETDRFQPVGAPAPLPFRGRVVAATHRDLRQMVAGGRFRDDLFFRLNVLTLLVPPLADHREDIPALAAHFLRRIQRPLRFSADALDALSGAPWPGGVRQLRNLIERLAVFADDDLVTAAALAQCAAPDELPGPAAAPSGEVLRRLAAEVLQLPHADKLAAVEQAVVAEAARRALGNKSAAARILGIDRKALDRRLGRSSENESGP
jgi:DNA-binding NtrC family response regulator